jgi:hypothetical protein
METVQAKGIASVAAISQCDWSSIGSSFSLRRPKLAVILDRHLYMSRKQIQTPCCWNLKCFSRHTYIYAGGNKTQLSFPDSGRYRMKPTHWWKIATVCTFPTVRSLILSLSLSGGMCHVYFSCHYKKTSLYLWSQLNVVRAWGIILVQESHETWLLNHAQPERVYQRPCNSW